MTKRSVALTLSIFCVFILTPGCGDNDDGGKAPTINQPATTNPPPATGGGGAGGTGGGGTGGGGTGGGGTGGGGTGGGGTGGGGTGGGGTGGGGTGGGGTTSLCPFADTIQLNTFVTSSPAGFYEGKTFTNGVADVVMGFSSFSYAPTYTYRIDDYVEIAVHKRGSGVPVYGRIRNLSRLTRTALMNATPTNPICFTVRLNSGDFNNDFGTAHQTDNVAAFLLDTIAGPDWKTTPAGDPIEISFFSDGTNAAIKTSSFEVIGRNGVDTDTVSIEGKARIIFYLFN